VETVNSFTLPRVDKTVIELEIDYYKHKFCKQFVSKRKMNTWKMLSEIVLSL
jgi:hypothetical protein